METDQNQNVKVKYIRDNAGKAYAIQQNGNLYYYLYNAHGDVTGITDGNGAVIATYTYDEFGNLKSSTGSIYNPLRYSGANNAYYDAETSLYKMGVRYYNPEIGRWITRDKAEPSEYEPETLHKYAFAKNNPISFIDPTGLAYLRFNGRIAKLYHDSGALWKGPYTTITGWPRHGWGVPGHGGPIPPGNYIADRKIKFDDYSSAWGRYALGGKPSGGIKYVSGSGYGMFTRSGFFVHGGDMTNSNGTWYWTHGCIKTRNGFIKFLYDNLTIMNGDKLTVKVRYRTDGALGNKDGTNNWSRGGYHYSQYCYGNPNRKIK